jgi:hypothetical protein
MVTPHFLAINNEFSLGSLWMQEIEKQRPRDFTN